MTESIFLINPRRKRRKSSRKGRQPAALKAYWAAKRGSGRKKRRKSRAVMANPRRRKSRRIRAKNPRRSRRKVSASGYKRRRHRNPRRRSSRRARMRNPFSTGGIKAALVPAAIGAGGAIALSVLYGYLAPSLPSAITGNTYGPVLLQAAGAIGLGMLLGKTMGKQYGQYVTAGGLTVVLVSTVTPFIASAAPSLPGLSGLRGFGDYIPYRRPGMGAYMKGGMKGLGFYSPAPTVRGKGMGAYMARKLPPASGMGAYMNRPVAGMADLSGGSGFNGLNDGM